MTRQLYPAAFLFVFSLGSLAGSSAASTLSYTDSSTAEAGIGLVASASGPTVRYFADSRLSDASSVALLDCTTGVASPFAYSDGAHPDGVAHAWTMPGPNGVVGEVSSPAAIYAGLEDLFKSQRSEFDYNDNTSVVTNVQSAWSATSTPEPASLALLGTGAFGAFALLHRRVR